MICKKCGHKNTSGQFCSECGELLNLIKNKPISKIKKYYMLIVVLFLIITCIAFGALVIMQVRSNNRLSKDMELIKENNQELSDEVLSLRSTDKPLQNETFEIENTKNESVTQTPTQDQDKEVSEFEQKLEATISDLEQKLEISIAENELLRTKIVTTQENIDISRIDADNLDANSDKGTDIFNKPKEISFYEFSELHPPEFDNNSSKFIIDSKISDYKVYPNYTHPYIGGNNYVTINGKQIGFENIAGISNNNPIFMLAFGDSISSTSVKFNIEKKYSKLRFKVLTDDAVLLKKDIVQYDDGLGDSFTNFFNHIETENGIVLPNGAVNVYGDEKLLYDTKSSLKSVNVDTHYGIILNSVELSVEVDISNVDVLNLEFFKPHLGIFDVFFMESDPGAIALKTDEIETLFYANGNKKYEGYMLNNLYHGQGISYYENGTIQFNGEFQYGLPIGSGIMYHLNGNKMLEGTFDNGMLHGIGKIYYPNGNLYYEGETYKNKPFAIYELGTSGKMYFDDGTLYYEGYFNISSTFSTKGIEYYSNGAVKYDGDWLDGKYNGEGTSYYPNGNIRYIGGWLDDLAHGKGTVYPIEGKNIGLPMEFKNGREVTKEIEDLIIDTFNSAAGFNLIEGAMLVSRYDINYETSIKDDELSIKSIVDMYNQINDLASFLN